VTFNQKEPSDIYLSFRFEKKVGHLLLGPVHSLDRRESVAFNRVFDVQQRDLALKRGAIPKAKLAAPVLRLENLRGPGCLKSAAQLC